MTAPQQNLNRTQENEHEALAAVVYESLGPVSIGLSFLYIFFAVAHSVILPQSIAWKMIIVASLSAVFFIALTVLLKQSLIPTRHAHLVALSIAQVVLLNSLLHLYFTEEIHQTTNILLAIVGAACFFLSTSSFIVILGTAFMGWELIMWSLPPAPERLHFAFSMFAATVLALLIFYVRLHIHRRLERLRLQDIQQKADLERALVAAQEVDRLKDDLISTVSHELRTPLTSLLGFTELMLQRNFPEAKQREILTIMHNESRRLTDLINNFLDLQAIEARRSQYRFAPRQIAPLLHEAIDLFSKADGKHTWQMTIPDNLPLVDIDEGRIRQVVTNLLANAVKFSTRGGVITVTVSCQPTELTISVSDQGIGIPQEAIPKLFTKFFRVDYGETRTTTGTGLGLALIKEIVEAHHGRIWVDSTLGEGSTFSFTLPLANELSEESEQFSAETI
jgi:signal transduction histidine kinase